jgi:hypothetical protein
MQARFLSQWIIEPEPLPATEWPLPARQTKIKKDKKTKKTKKTSGPGQRRG